MKHWNEWHVGALEAMLEEAYKSGLDQQLSKMK